MHSGRSFPLLRVRVGPDGRLWPQPSALHPPSEAPSEAWWRSVLAGPKSPVRRRAFDTPALPLKALEGATLRLRCDACFRNDIYDVARLMRSCGPDVTLLDAMRDLTRGCLRLQSPNDPCRARFEDF